MAKYKPGDLVEMTGDWNNTRAGVDVLTGDKCIIVEGVGSPGCWEILNTRLGIIDSFHQTHFRRVKEKK